jgi:hypothetical protein
MNRRKLEATTTYLAVIDLGVLILLSIVGVADGLFSWDILPPFLDKIAVLIIASLSIVLVGCILVSIMINVSVIADKLAQLVDRERPK